MGNVGLTIRNSAAAALVALVVAAMLALAGCAGPSNEVSNEDKAQAKTVIKAASNVFATTESLDLTDQDSPATIDQNDPRFADFFSELQAYKTMAGMDLKDCSFKVTIQSVTASTARGDSTQTNYRYTITGADMDVNGVGVAYDTKAGFSSK